MIPESEVKELPNAPCNISQRGKSGVVVYIGINLASRILETMPLSKDTNTTYIAFFDDEAETILIKKVRSCDI